MSTSYLTAPSMDNPTTPINGQGILYGNRLNRIAIGGFVVIGILFVVFLYLYISPLFQERPIKHRSKESIARTTASSDTEAGVDMDPAERKILLAWMHRRSRGRFVDVTLSAPQNPQIPRPPKLEPRSDGKRVNSFFSRISMFPHLVFPSLPPPVYSAPPTPICAASDSSSLDPQTGKRPFFPAYRLSFRSKSAPSDPEEVTSRALNRASMASSGCPVDDTSTSSLPPQWIPRLQSPSKAVLVNKARDCSPLSGAEAGPPTTSEMKTKPRKMQLGVPKNQGLSRARVVGESVPF